MTLTFLPCRICLPHFPGSMFACQCCPLCWGYIIHSAAQSLGGGAKSLTLCYRLYGVFVYICRVHFKRLHIVLFAYLFIYLHIILCRAMSVTGLCIAERHGARKSRKTFLTFFSAPSLCIDTRRQMTNDAGGPEMYNPAQMDSGLLPRIVNQSITGAAEWPHSSAA